MKANDPASDFESFKEEQSILILLNLAVLAGLVLVHVSFLTLLGPPSRLLILLVTARFLSLIAELIWLQNTSLLLKHWPFIAYRRVAIWFSIAFAFLASYVAGSEGVAGEADIHYSVLMVLPIIS